MSVIARIWLAQSPGYPATTNIVGDEADLADYRAQNWIIQGPFVLEADLLAAVDVERIARVLAEHISGVTARQEGEPVDVCRFHRDLAAAIVGGQ